MNLRPRFRMDNVATYSEARSEYTKQLATFIVPALLGWFQQVWSRNANNRQQCMALFQTECEEISRWNQDRVTDEVRVLIERTKCDYMEELMKAVFIAHMKVLTAVRLSDKMIKLRLEIPKLDHFIHRIFKEAARSFWKAPYLFMDITNVIERQKNILQLEAMTTEAITTAVRGMLPVKQILHDYLDGGEQEDIDDTKAPESEVVTPRATIEAPVLPAPVVETTPESVSAPAPVSEPPVTTTIPLPDVSTTPVPETEPVKEQIKEIDAPDVIKIDTEPAVRFSDYDAEFGESGAVMKYAPKEDDADDDNISDIPSDGALQVDESSTRDISDADLDDDEPPHIGMTADDDDESLGDIEILE